MGELCVLVPVLARPGNVAPLLESIRSTTPGATVLFLTDSGDDLEVDAIVAEGGEHVTVNGGYARKINVGLGCTDEPLIFVGADDLRPCSGWFDAARAKIGEGFEVVGVNDLLDRPHRPQHATHFLVTRDYAGRGQVDGNPGLLCEKYFHERVDDELIDTATRRGVYAYAEDAHVEHLHHLNGMAEDDHVYQRGREHWRNDRRLFMRRRRLWS